MATSNLDWMSLRTSSLSSDETKVMARPLVPKRPARLKETRRGQRGALAKRGWTGGSPDTVKVRVGVSGRVVVDNNCKDEE